MKKKGLDAYLTIFFTLLLMVFVALSLMLIEGVRSNAMRLELEIAFDTALDSASGGAFVLPAAFSAYSVVVFYALDGKKRQRRT